MKKLMQYAWLLLFVSYVSQLRAEAASLEPRFLLSYNALETLAFIAANEIFVAPKEPKLSYIPFHFDFAMRLNQQIGLALGLIYRYENYRDQGPLYSAGGALRSKKIWTDYHELFMLAGPRFSLQDKGIVGLFVETKGGWGLARSPSYFALSALLEPKVGYSMVFGPGLALSVGIGVLLNMPFYETIDFAVLGSKAQRFNIIGFLVHQAIPIVDIGLGFAW